MSSLYEVHSSVGQKVIITTNLETGENKVHDIIEGAVRSEEHTSELQSQR